jgi:hypothetical protein
MFIIIRKWNKYFKHVYFESWSKKHKILSLTNLDLDTFTTDLWQGTHRITLSIVTFYLMIIMPTVFMGWLPLNESLLRNKYSLKFSSFTVKMQKAICKTWIFFVTVAVLDRGKCCAVRYYFVIYSLTEIHFWLV